MKLNFLFLLFVLFSCSTDKDEVEPDQKINEKKAKEQIIGTWAIQGNTTLYYDNSGGLLHAASRGTGYHPYTFTSTTRSNSFWIEGAFIRDELPYTIYTEDGKVLIRLGDGPNENINEITYMDSKEMVWRQEASNAEYFLNSRTEVAAKSVWNQIYRRVE
ncbi:hypothetical protein FVR03_21130 [Pontibacter qinzhouensis]|uniref:Lipocalin-like domain-containing protein n=1 Tax=Pontibacter qinzhouensis TaxID=2603253 RepID=A0A5C8J185_9BACT|nr:hypothetical protein [Pontibacter qinzhouensis]TXK27402.1 hypothetical protein FVR03_21130 [Pontibacter qinzhouensis]